MNNTKQTWRLTDREVEILNAALQNLDNRVELDDAQDQKILKDLSQRFQVAVELRKPK